MSRLLDVVAGLVAAETTTTGVGGVAIGGYLTVRGDAFGVMAMLMSVIVATGLWFLARR